MSEQNEATAAAEAPAETVTPSDDLLAIVEFIDVETGKINARETKSNYHNARKSAFKQIRDLILPPPPKPEKVKKEKKAKVVKGEPVPVEQPASATPEVEGETQVVPIEEGA